MRGPLLSRGDGELGRASEVLNGTEPDLRTWRKELGAKVRKSALAVCI